MHKYGNWSPCVLNLVLKTTFFINDPLGIFCGLYPKVSITKQGYKGMLVLKQMFMPHVVMKQNVLREVTI